METVFLNRQFALKSQAAISILDRGFLFGDAVYEVIPYFTGTPLGLTEHLHRLESNLNALGIPNPYSVADWTGLLTELQHHNRLRNATYYTYIQVTRGASPVRQHECTAPVNPTVLAFCQTFEPIDHSNGHAAILRADNRHGLCQIKTTNLLANTLHKNSASQVGALEAILFKDHHITEGTSSNVFMVKKNQLLTPPLTDNILPGITRQYVIKTAKMLDFSYHERPITVNEFIDADEIWVSSSTKLISPITQLDTKPVGPGHVGPVWKLFNNAMRRHIPTSTQTKENIYE